MQHGFPLWGTVLTYTVPEATQKGHSTGPPTNTVPLFTPLRCMQSLNLQNTLLASPVAACTLYGWREECVSL